MQKPAFERADFGVVFESTHFFGHRDDRLLYYFLGFGVGESGPEGHSVNQFPIGIEEVFPAFLVVPVLQAVEQASTRRDQVLWISCHRV